MPNRDQGVQGRYTQGGFWPGQGQDDSATGFAAIPTNNPIVDSSMSRGFGGTNNEFTPSGQDQIGQGGGETGPGSSGFNPSITGFNADLAGQGLNFVGNVPGNPVSAIASGLGGALTSMGNRGSNLSNENGPVSFTRDNTLIGGLQVPPAVARAAQTFGLRGGQFTQTDTGEALPGFDAGGPQGPGIQGPGMTSLGRSGEGRSAADMTFAGPTTAARGGGVDPAGPPGTVADITNSPDANVGGPTGSGPSADAGGNTGSGTGTGVGDAGAGGTGGTAGDASMRGGLIVKGQSHPQPGFQKLQSGGLAGNLQPALMNQGRPDLAQGGPITAGDPNAKQDDVPAMLHEGEFVIPKPAMERLAQKEGGYQQAAMKIKELVIRFAQEPANKGMSGMESMYQRGIGRNIPKPAGPRQNPNQP